MKKVRMIKLAITLYPHKTRVITFYSHDDNCVPSCLSENVGGVIDFTPGYPLPFAKKDITAIRNYGDVYWLASDKGLARYCASEAEIYDRVMYFSADRDMKDNKILALCGSEDEIWVKTETCVSHIELKMMSMEEKAEILLDETLTIVDRLGMVSQRRLDEGWNKASAQPYACSDNDGGFTAMYCMGLIFRYAVFKREKGADHEDTIRARATAIRSLEACLLLMFISGRGNGFVARTYVTTADPVPDDGLFFRKQNGVATVVETSGAKERGYVGMTCDASAPIPERLSKLYKDAGFTDDDIIYKGDTSSDETTLHLICYYYAHEILGKEDEELDELIKTAIKNFMDHVIEHGYELHDFHGGPTSWAKWSQGYFTGGIGWCDACLNANEMLMYLKLAQKVCGENELWESEYKRLVDLGYADLGPLHYDRAFAASIPAGCDIDEDIMYGDHMLSNISFFGLSLFEDDAELRDLYHKSWLNWRETSVDREHHPIYDIPYILTHPERPLDEERIKMWFYRNNSSMMASSVSLESRRDVAAKEFFAGYKQTSYLLPQDERPISKYDRDSLHLVNEESGGKFTIETCKAFTTPYWMGRYFGIIEEGGNN